MSKVENNKEKTFQDISRKTGVSTKTVSLALRGKPGVSKITREKIKQVAIDLKVDISKSTSRSNRGKLTIGVCVPDLAEHYSELTQEIIRYAGLSNAAVVPQITGDNWVDEERALKIFKRLNIGAVVLTSTRISKKAIDALNDAGIIIVSMVSCPIDKHPSPFLATYQLQLDHFNSTCEATRHLIQLGHQQIAYLAGPGTSYSNKAKLAGYLKALNESKIDINYQNILESERSDCETGFQQCRELTGRSLNDRPTAIVCYSDEVALGALSQLRDKNIKVPEEMSVVGWDDIKHSRYWFPPLTTVNVPRSVMAGKAVDIIYECMNKSLGAYKIVENIKPRLILRSSTGVCKKSS